MEIVKKLHNYKTALTNSERYELAILLENIKSIIGLGVLEGGSAQECCEDVDDMLSRA